MSRYSTSDISWPLNRPAERGAWDPNNPDPIRPQQDVSAYLARRRPVRNNNDDDDGYSSDEEEDKAAVPADFHHSGRRSISGIALRAYILGVVSGAGLIATIIFLIVPYLPSSTSSSSSSSHSSLHDENKHITRYWRAPFFLATVSLFHFLEFYITATYNVPHATISSFLLSTNGRGYNAANAAALFECFVTSLLFPNRQSSLNHPVIITTGFALVLLGQVVRSIAMAQAGTNFNHHVQTRRNEGHVLVKSGVYAWLRHPSYFGFFWWAVGTQIVLGNIVCLVGYAVVLWRFFRYRIEG